MIDVVCVCNHSEGCVRRGEVAAEDINVCVCAHVIVACSCGIRLESTATFLSKLNNHGKI